MVGDVHRGPQVRQEEEAGRGGEAQHDPAEKAGGLEKLLGYTNNRMLTGYTGGKILWLRDEEPDNFARMAKFTCPKDYIRLLLTDELAIDVSDASGTGFFNTRERAWSDELIALAGLDQSIFPAVLESTALAGRVTREAAPAPVPPPAAFADGRASRRGRLHRTAPATRDLSRS